MSVFLFEVIHMVRNVFVIRIFKTIQAKEVTATTVLHALEVDKTTIDRDYNVISGSKLFTNIFKILFLLYLYNDNLTSKRNYT